MVHRSKKAVIATLFGNLGIAGTLSIREGYHKFLNPEPISHIGLIYLAIAVGLIFDGYAFAIAVKNIKNDMRIEQHRNLIEGRKQIIPKNHP